MKKYRRFKRNLANCERKGIRREMRVVAMKKACLIAKEKTR